jgi:signal transduction histidine kinase
MPLVDAGVSVGRVIRDHGARLDMFVEPSLFVALVVLGESELFVPALRAEFHGPRWINAILVIAIATAVLWRRRAPLAAFAMYAAFASVWLAAVYGPNASLPIEPLVVLLVLIYSAATYIATERERWVALVVGLIFASEVLLLVLGRKSVGNAVPGLLFIGLAYILGRILRGKHALASSFELKAARASAESEARARAAVSEERARIARELHDVIAHHVSVMVVQAGAAGRLFTTDSQAAADALEAIRHAGTEAIDELRRLLGLLREAPAPELSTEPQPGLHRIEPLLAEARSTGLAVDCTIEGEPRDLPEGLDLAAYRIVQEALTNVRKHSPAQTAEVVVRYLPRQLELLISDPGAPGKHANGERPGHGLVGMRERVALYGGTLEAGTGDGSGFVVHAQMPIPDQA